MVSCENCGAENEDDINFCRVCGSRLSNQDENLSRIVQVVTSDEDSADETSFNDYKAFELKKINSVSFGKINYFLFVSLSLIFAIITVVLKISSINLPIYTSMGNIVISSLIDILRIFLASLIIGVIVFGISCIFSWIYNKLSTKISGIKFNINEDNKINKIHYSSLKIIMFISVIELLIMDVLVFIISFNIDTNDFTLFVNALTPSININLMEFIRLLLGFDVIFLIFTLIFTFLFIILFNLISSKYPLKLGLKSNIANNVYSLDKIYIKNFIITVGIPLIILQLLLSLINFTLIYVLIVVISVILYMILVTVIYNFISKKLGGYEINLEV
ncbi:MAG: zinc-ribbon domain-containing protein [Methanosphaera stadtmanae]|nr:zinc-ribbon domain-containing protein [Methanosphaera stadtmanae]